MAGVSVQFPLYDLSGVVHCFRRVIAKLAEFPDDGDLQYRVGTIVYRPSEAEWADGGCGVQCFLWSDDRDLTRSMKGAGTKGPTDQARLAGAGSPGGSA